MGIIASINSRQKLRDFVSWFEIPAYDIHRATAFYNFIYRMTMETSGNGEFSMAFFPVEQGVGGAIVAGPGCTPNATGPLIYLNAGEDMDDVIGRVEEAGGRVIMARTTISDSAGSFALFVDSEGNRLALHEGPKRPTSARSRSAQTSKTTKARPAGKTPATRKAAKTVTRRSAAKRR